MTQSVTIAYVLADVAQLVRAPDCGPGGRGFNSRLSPQIYENTRFNSEYFILLLSLCHRLAAVFRASIQGVHA